MAQRSLAVRIVLLAFLLLLITAAGLSTQASHVEAATAEATTSATPTKTPTKVPTTAVPPTLPPTATAAQTATPTNTPDPFFKSIQVYFTDPTTANENDLSTDKYVTRYVIPLIQSATQTIDVTSFDLNLPVALNALVEASKRGVQIRVVYDGVNGKTSLGVADNPSGIKVDTLAMLSAAKIPFVNGGRSNGLMHNKMIIIDHRILIMGSWNMSYNDTYRNNNNLLIVTNPTLIANYQAKFNEMFVDKRFGTKSINKVLIPQVTIEGSLVENYFSPRDEVMDKIVSLVKSAKKSVRFLAFTYTDMDLVNAMIDREQAGLTVEGVVETRSASYLIVPTLYCAKVGVKNDGNQYTFHHKVLIIDDEIVVTGSFNFTETADTANDDNVLILHNKAIASLYNAEFTKQYALAKRVYSADINCDTVGATATAVRATSVQATSVKVNQTATKSIVQTGTASVRATQTSVKATKIAGTPTVTPKP